MKLSTLICTFLVLLCLIPVPAESAAWENLGLTGGNITDLASFPANPDIMLACVAGHGIYRSTDRGDYWSQIISDPCYDISISEDDVAFAAGETGVLVSHDFGETWETVSDVAASQVVAYRDGIVAINPKISYDDPTVWTLSQDNGETWDVWAGTENTVSILFHTDSSVYRSAARKIYRSKADDWNAWNVVKDYSVSIFTVDLRFGFAYGDSSVYAYSKYADFHPAGTQNGGVYRSNDGGLSWARYTDENFNSVTALVISGDTLLFGGSQYGEAPHKLLKSPVGSQESTVIGTFGSDIIAIDIRKFNNGEIIVATKGGIFKTSNSGLTWENSGTGIMHQPISSVQITTLPNDIERIIISTQDNGVHYSNDNGESWILADPNIHTIPGLLKVTESSPQRIYAAEASIYMSDDFGETWELIPSLPIAYYGWYGRTVDIDVDPQNANRVVVNYSSHSIDDWRGIFTIIGEYTDRELNPWEWNSQLDIFDGRSSFRSQFSSDFLLWISKDYHIPPTQPILTAINEMGEIVKTITMPDNEWASIWNVDGQNCYALNREENRILISSDYGETWNVTELQLEDYIRYDDWAAEEPLGEIVFSPDKSTLFLLYPGNGILASTDNGMTWGHFDDGIDTDIVYQLAFSPSDPSVMYAATEDGLYRCDSPVVITDVISAVEQTTEPAAYPVIQAYPNPFNPATTITYTLPTASAVTLSVYAVTGQKVVVLIDRPMAAGTHAAVFDGTGLASGVYFARLEAGGAIQTRKLLLVK